MPSIKWQEAELGFLNSIKYVNQIFSEIERAI